MSEMRPGQWPGPVQSASTAPRRRSPRLAPRETQRKTAAQTGGQTAARTASKSAVRGARRRLSPMARKWHRLYPGLRRDLERYQPLVLFAALSLGLLAVYGIWSSGVVGRTGERVGAVGGSVLSAGGFKIGAVTMTGREHVREADVLTALGAREGDSLLDFDAKAARVRLEALPWVKTATVMRLLPDRLHVTVAERAPYAIWQHDGTFTLIDREGRELERLSAETIEPFSHLPQVVGEGANTHAAELLDLLEGAPALMSRLKAASRVGDRRWNLRLDNGIDVRLPDTEVAEAIRDIIELDSQYRLLARRISVIDLRLPDVLIVRPRAPGGGLEGAGTKGGRRIVSEDRKA